MSVTTRVGPWKFIWSKAPLGTSGSAAVRAEGPKGSLELQVGWRTDPQGLVIHLPESVRGFDLITETDDNSVRVHWISERNSSEQWNGIRHTFGDRAPSQSAERTASAGPVKVKAQMPGKIVRILTEVGRQVEKGQPLILMEAMKMENEIKAPRAGTVSEIKVTAGQVIETGAQLLLIAPSFTAGPEK